MVTITAGTPTLAIAGAPIAAITTGASGTSTVSVAPGGGFSGAVNLTCSVAGPTGATSVPTCSYCSTSVTISGTAAATSTLTVTTTSTSTAGSYTVTVNAADAATGKVTATGSLPVTVSAPIPASFTVSGTAVTVAPGATSGNTSTITVTPANGFTGPVNLSAS